jgi:transposase InsO family protein
MPFIDEHRQRLGVEPICEALQIAPSAYWREDARRRDPARLPARRQRDAALLPEIERVWRANLSVYGADKVWKQLRRENVAVARCTVERLVRAAGLRGVTRGKGVRTTVPDAKAPCPLDRVNREFRADRPNRLWVSDFTYVSTWQGFVYVAFVIDVFARYIVGWRVSSSMQADFVLDALEQALYARRGQLTIELVHHSDRGSQYVSIRYTERLLEAGIEPSVGSKGDSYDKGYVSHCTSFARSGSSAPSRRRRESLAPCILRGASSRSGSYSRRRWRRQLAPGLHPGAYAAPNEQRQALRGSAAAPQREASQFLVAGDQAIVARCAARRLGVQRRFFLRRSCRSMLRG